MVRALRLLIVVVIVFFLVRCTKEGPTGPQGAQGPPGPQGNANVKAIIFTNQAFTFNQLVNVYQILQTVPDITADIVQKGSVSAFVAKANNNNSDWTALPGNFTPDFSNPSLSRFFDFNYAPGNATIYTTTDPGYNVDVKFVIVAGP
jgi:hypothetical protein